MRNQLKSVPSISVPYARNGTATKSSELGMRAMQKRTYEKRTTAPFVGQKDTRDDA